MVKVRFAPSPTGYLHIGSARTALFNWLFARNRKGKFILRIEDTDIARSDKKYLEEILDSLKWAGLDWDEIYYQSQRFSLYKEYAQRLTKEGKAYTQTTDEGRGTPCLPAGRTDAVIFKVEPQKIRINDLIHGEIEFDASVIKDQVLMKSDGTPTYNFACVIDDALLGITHVIRGDDHISNTPKQIMLYQALGFKIPEFCHIPLILDKAGGRMSKRKGAVSIGEYQNMGYLPEAVVNYLMLLGWSPGENKEVVSLDEAVKLFSLEKLNKTAAVFDIDKLNWLNNHYLKNSDPQRLTELVIPILLDKGLVERDNFDRNYILDVVKLFKERINNLNDLADWADFFFKKEICPDTKAEEKLKAKDYSQEFSLLIKRLEALSNFDSESIEDTFRQLTAELNIKAKELIHPVRAAISGKTIGPGLFEMMAVLGKEKIIERLRRFIR